jgi:hypothetical protein
MVGGWNWCASFRHALLTREMAPNEQWLERRITSVWSSRGISSPLLVIGSCCIYGMSVLQQLSEWTCANLPPSSKNVAVRSMRKLECILLKSLIRKLFLLLIYRCSHIRICICTRGDFQMIIARDRRRALRPKKSPWHACAYLGIWL